MRKRFWVGSIICLLATSSILTFVAISDGEGCSPQYCEKGVCAGARISGAARLKAKGTVRSPSNCWGGWGINVRAGSASNNRSDYYSGGTRKSLDVSQHTSQARATSWITGYNVHDESYYANACDSRP